MKKLLNFGFAAFAFLFGFASCGNLGENIPENTGENVSGGKSGNQEIVDKSVQKEKEHSEKTGFSVGDFIIQSEDGKFSAVSSADLGEEDKSKVLAVCFGFSEDGIPLGLGTFNSYALKAEGRLAWAKKESFGATQKFEKIVCIPSSLENPETFEGKKSGESNMDEVMALDEEFRTGDNYAELYPVFGFALNYGEVCVLSGGWYIPTSWEIYKIYRNLETLQTSLSLCGGTSLVETANSYYYTSSQAALASKVYKINLKSGKFSVGEKTTSSKEYALAVREFPVD